MPQQTVFDLDGRQEIEKVNNELEDKVSDLKTELEKAQLVNDRVTELEAEVELLKAKMKDWQSDLKRLTKYDIEEGGCDESTCNAKMKAHRQGDYVTWSEVERICEL